MFEVICVLCGSLRIVNTYIAHIWATNHNCTEISNSTFRLTSCHGLHWNVSSRTMDLVFGISICCDFHLTHGISYTIEIKTEIYIWLNFHRWWNSLQKRLLVWIEWWKICCFKSHFLFLLLMFPLRIDLFLSNFL